MSFGFTIASRADALLGASLNVPLIREEECVTGPERVCVKEVSFIIAHDRWAEKSSLDVII